MAARKAAALHADLLVRKGDAQPATAETPAPPALPHGIKETVAVTVRLDAERYHRLVAYGARFTPRRTNQDILVAALDAFLSRTP
jgi:hypothetical protein